MDLQTEKGSLIVYGTIMGIFGNREKPYLPDSEKQPECIDHIAISERFCGDADITVGEWNIDKSLSDYKGMVV